MKTSEDPAARVVVDAENPWPGLDYFGEKSQEFFHGREAEADLLLTMVRHRLLTVLYGQSGLGKSSLLQAGLFPRLRADGWLPVYIRLSHTDADGLGGKGPSALVAQTRQFIREAIADAIEQGQLLGLTNQKSNDPSPMPRDDESLWEYLHRRTSGLRSTSRERVAPVLVFDQFEEIFTLGRNETRQAIRHAFLHDLADCVENRLPEHVLEEMNRRQPGDTSKFSDLDFSRQDYRVVVSLREDYLAELHDLSDLMPSIHENETRLVPLNGWQALDAVAIPGEALVEPVVAREIVEIVAASRRGEVEDGNGAALSASDGQSLDESKLEVDPALLSMVCRGLNEERQRRKQPKITQEITNDLLKNSGRSILHRFYLDCFDSLPDRATAPQVQKFVEDELLTPGGYRNMAELVRAQNRLANSGVPDPTGAIQRLIDERLLRISERRQDKTKWLELTHDVLCDVVKESRQAREIREEKERQEREEQERAARRLEEAERQRVEAETQARQARERESEAVARLKHMRRERRLGITVLVLAVLFAGTLWVIYRQSKAASEERWRASQAQRDSGVEAQRRSQKLLESAQNWLRRPNDDRRNVLALRQLARAIRNNRGNAEAVKLACHLLVEKNWCPPLSLALHYPGSEAQANPAAKSPLISAGLSPDNREIVAVARDGHLVRWDAETYEPRASLRLVPDKMTGANDLVVNSAAFSRDGKRILIGLFPTNRENARLWNWSDEDGSYHPADTTVEFKEPIRSLAWSGDRNTLFVFPMSFVQPVCRVFKLEGKVFKERATIPNASAGDLSFDDQWLATAVPGGGVQILDARTLRPAPATEEMKTTFEPAESNPDTRLTSLVFSSDGRELAATSMREPARLWNVRTGAPKALKPKSQRDQVMRIVFAPGFRGGRSIAAGMNGAVGIWDTDQLDQMRAEPLCVQDAFVYPTFSSDGRTLVTLSGSFWQSLETVRAWDVSFREPELGASALRFSGNNPPEWLDKLADAVAGLKQASEEDEEPPDLLSALRRKYGGTPESGEYAPVWRRFLAKGDQ